MAKAPRTVCPAHYLAGVSRCIRFSTDVWTAGVLAGPSKNMEYRPRILLALRSHASPTPD
jgi:hypothetical protein